MHRRQTVTLTMGYMSMERIGSGSMKSSPINWRKQFNQAFLLPHPPHRPHQLHWHRIPSTARIRRIGERLQTDLSGVEMRINKASSPSILTWDRSQMGAVNTLHYLVQP